jgi:hypothetical protein
MIYQEVIFTKKECETIMNLRNNHKLFFVTPESSLIKNTRTVYHKEKNFNGVGYDNSKDWVKRYNVWDIPINKETFWFYDRIYKWFSELTNIQIDREKYFNRSDAAHKIHEYNIGDKFDLHADQNDGSIDRIWNLGIQLNSNYEGGDYICYDKNNHPINISKETGNTIAYSSDVLHEINEILQGKRYSLVVKIYSWELYTKKNKSFI